MLYIAKALRKFWGFTIMLLQHLRTLPVTQDVQRTLIVGTSRQIRFYKFDTDLQSTFYLESI